MYKNDVVKSDDKIIDTDKILSNNKKCVYIPPKIDVVCLHVTRSGSTLDLETNGGGIDPC